MPTIIEVIDPVRGCGKRKPGGLYLVSGANGSACCGLPLALTVCPCCGQGVKFSRGFTWIEPKKLFSPQICTADRSAAELLDRSVFFKILCPLQDLPEKMGLLWVGEQFYSVKDFTSEAAIHGISKRIAFIPNDFELGKTWLALAHKKAVIENNVEKNGFTPAYGPGVFMFFKPSRIEYIVIGTEPPEFLDRLEKRGVTLVRVIGHIGEQQTLSI